MKSALLPCALTLCVAAPCVFAAEAEPLPGTRPLTWEDELDARLMDGAHAFIERRIAESAEARAAHWNRDFSSREAYESSVEPNRQRFRRMIGLVDERLPPHMQFIGEDRPSALVAENEHATVHQVRWPVLEHIWGEGLLLRPRRVPPGQWRHLLYLPDADQTPEQALGLADAEHNPEWVGIQLAAAGYQVLIPTLIDRRAHHHEAPWRDRSDQTHREWVYRQAFQMGRHVIGYEVQMVLAAADWIESRYGQDAEVTLAGYGEGGLIAFYAAAADPRIDRAVVEGYFGPRQSIWSEPIDRNVFGLLREFGDAEIAGLVAPRPLFIVNRPRPRVSNRKGEIGPVADEAVRAEFARFRRLAGPFAQSSRLVDEPNAAELLDIKIEKDASQRRSLTDRRRGFDPAARQKRLVRGMERHVQSLVRRSERHRRQWFPEKIVPELADRTWNYHADFKPLPPEKLVEGAKPYRRILREDIIGAFDEPKLPSNPRTRKVYDTPRYTGYEVVLDVYPELFAWGILLVPKDLRPGERRPVVVCQHGRNGLPAQTIEGDSPAYRNFAARLADRGFITFSPHNLYRGEDRYRWLDRKANAIGRTLFSFILAQHEQITGWLASLDFADPDRIAFYGLSYGGETAVRIPALVPRYALSICSGDFNQWTRKVASVDHPWSFMYTIEWEMPYFNMGWTFDYAELACLIFPRPFMVERGMHDWVGRDEWVAHEYAKVRWLYTQFGLADRTRIEYFNGGHTIHGRGTFDFLHEHLNFPPPADN